MAARSLTAEDPFTAAMVAEAKEAGLRYTNDSQPGICRKKRGEGFTYVNASGETVRDKPTLARIKRLARSRFLNYQSMIKQWLSERLEQELGGPRG